MKEFAMHHRSATSMAPAGFTPKGGDLVSAKFSDGAWYRAKVKRASAIKKEAEVTFIGAFPLSPVSGIKSETPILDYGNQDTISFANIRPLDAKFKALPGQAHDARLR